MLHDSSPLENGDEREDGDSDTGSDWEGTSQDQDEFENDLDED